MTPFISHIARQAKGAGGRALVVGGAVRDQILGITPKDADLEVYGIPEKEMEPFLEGLGAKVARVGRSFPVWKAWTPEMGQGEAVDVALPRREIKTGPKHTDFKTILDPSMTFADAASRRDFTVNAIGLDPLTGEYIDPHGGVTDLLAGRLKHVSSHFAEDPLRVMRGAQFCARLGLTADPSTVAFCKELSPEHLVPERLNEEWRKLLLKGKKPSAGLNFLRDCEWTKHFPEIEAMIGVPQDSTYHPEGDVWTHTLHCLDAYASQRTGDEAKDIRVGLAVLCHDMGKPATTEMIDGRWRAFGHEAAGESPARQFMQRIKVGPEVAADVIPLVVEHMNPKNLYKNAQDGQRMDSAVRRLSTRVNLQNLASVCWCDEAGRPPLPQQSPCAEWLRQESARLGVVNKPPVPLIKGRDLMSLGFEPGRHFGDVLGQAMERQINGEFLDAEAALAWAQTHPSLQSAPRMKAVAPTISMHGA
jgi:tRNA nucleotidyltransferase (CCA-adding enzyme)